MILKGRVKSGFGNASFWVDKINPIFQRKYNMELFLGTLNLELEQEYVLEQEEKILASEYGGNFDVLIKECKVLDSKGYIVRTEKNNQTGGDHTLNIVEIVSDLSIRDLYGLKDGDEVSLHI